MSDDFGYSLEDRELFLEFLKTGTVWGIYYGMSEAEIIEKFGLPAAQDDDEISSFGYRWFDINLKHFPFDNWRVRRAISIDVDSAPLSLFGMKPRNEDDASRVINWLDKRNLIESQSQDDIYLKSGVKIESRIISTKKYARLLDLRVEAELERTSQKANSFSSFMSLK